MIDIHVKACTNTEREIRAGECWALVLPRSDAGRAAVAALQLPQDRVFGSVTMRSAAAVEFAEACIAQGLRTAFN